MNVHVMGRNKIISLIVSGTCRLIVWFAVMGITGAPQVAFIGALCVWHTED